MARKPKRGISLTEDDVRFISLADGAVLAVIAALVTHLAEDGLLIEDEFIDSLHIAAMDMEARGTDPALIAMFRSNTAVMTPMVEDEHAEPVNENEPG